MKAFFASGTSILTRVGTLLFFGFVHFVVARATIVKDLSPYMCMPAKFDVGGIIHQMHMFECFGVYNFCEKELESVSQLHTSNRICHSTSFVLLVCMFVVEVAQN